MPGINSHGHVPQRPQANIPVGAETQTRLNHTNTLYESGELYVEDFADFSEDPEVSPHVDESFESFAAELRRFLEASEENASESATGLMSRVDMWMQMISWTDRSDIHIHAGEFMTI